MSFDSLDKSLTSCQLSTLIVTIEESVPPKANGVGISSAKTTASMYTSDIDLKSSLNGLTGFYIVVARFNRQRL